ncbi:MAG: hypothetical protein HOP16_12970 [Acidobacteria bacterium]|nr:hypothetical protein [Acidobacteriota bacterium]
MSPILVRPVREQLEHDRVIRLLQAKYKKKFDVAINPGTSLTTPVLIGNSPWYPDLVLLSADRGRKPLGTVEVETAESVNHLEAMSQWAAFARLRAPLHLYVPAASIDTAKRLCTDLQIPVAEIWAFSSLGDQMRFALVHRNAKSPELKGRETPERAPKPAERAPKPAQRAASSAKATNGRAAPKAKKASAVASAKSSASKGKPAAKKSSAKAAAPRQKATAAAKRKRK